MDRDAVLASGVYNCVLLRKEKTAALKELKALSMIPAKPVKGPANEEGRAEWAASLARYKNVHCQFLSTDSRLFVLYASNMSFVFVTLLTPVVFFHQVAMTSQMSEQLLELSQFMAPNAISEMVKRSKSRLHEEVIAVLISSRL